VTLQGQPPKSAAPLASDVVQGEICEVFSTTISSKDWLGPLGLPLGQLRLQDICQQNVTIVDEDGHVVFDHAEYGPSCM
jgi:hypothetical protein